jgi:hypothetical protein
MTDTNDTTAFNHAAFAAALNARIQSVIDEARELFDLEWSGRDRPDDLDPGFDDPRRSSLR